MDSNVCKVSVITTVYNVGDYLNQCIDSILNQTLQDIELILVNDCSTDNSLEVINSYDDSRIKLINNDENVGCGMSRQIGIDNAVGEYTMFVDGDDYIESDCLEMMYNAAVSNDTKIVNCLVNGHNPINPNYLSTFLNNKLIKRTLWELTNYSPLRYLEERPTLYRLFDLCDYNVYELPYYGYNYTFRPDSLTHTNDYLSGKVFECLGIIENIEYSKEHNTSIRFKLLFNDIMLKLKYNTFKDINSEELREEIEIINNYIKNIE
jgi:glycosyltransferase involved in cell wall biosynthesis